MASGSGLGTVARVLDLAVHEVTSRAAEPAEDLEETLVRLAMVPVLEDRIVPPACQPPWLPR